MPTVAVQRAGLNIDVDRKQTVLGVGTTGYRTDIIFPRGNHTNVLLWIKSNEALGVLDTGYIEDYFGTDGYITLKKISDGTRVSYPVIALPDETPGIDNDMFQVTIALSSLENTTYEVEGRVRDIIGNYTIFGAVDTPIGGEDITTLTMQIVEGYATSYVYEIGSIAVRAA